MVTYKSPDYQSLAEVTAELCGDYIDFAGVFFTLSQADQPGFLAITYAHGPAGTLRYDAIEAAIDTEVIVRREVGS